MVSSDITLLKYCRNDSSRQTIPQHKAKETGDVWWKHARIQALLRDARDPYEDGRTRPGGIYMRQYSQGNPRRRLINGDDGL